MSEFFHQVLHASRMIIPALQTRKPSLLAHHKQGTGGDISIGADLLCEEIFYKYCSHMAHINSEESGFLPSSTASPHCPTIILDPLDGSNNYLSGIPYFGASLALCDEKGVAEAMVINFCAKEALYSNRQSSTQKIDIFTQAMLPITSIHAPCGIFEKSYANPRLAQSLHTHGYKFRSLGASALSMAYALEHEFFLFHGAMRDVDKMAGLFLCRHLAISQSESYVLISQHQHVFAMIQGIINDTYC